MKIVTVSASPYLLTKLGRLNSKVIEYLTSQGHDVCSVVWDHDATYFMADDEKKFYFENGCEKVCRLFPLKEKFARETYDVVEEFGADVVLSIGDYHETEFIKEIKRAYNNDVKWVALLTINALPINPEYIPGLKRIDSALVTTDAGRMAFSRNCHKTVDHAPVGIDTEVFFPEEKSPEEFRVMTCAKNSKACNLGGAIASIGLSERATSAYIHTNINDEGDFDILGLAESYDRFKIMIFPEKFSSIQENISDSDLRKEYSKSTVFLDLSMQSSTSMSVLEAMACGCIPVVTPTISMKEVLLGLPDCCFVPSEDFIGDREEVLIIGSIKGASERIDEIYNMWKYRPKEYMGLRRNCIEIARRFLDKKWENNIDKALERAKEQNGPVMVVDILT